ncbi:ParA family protein [Kribbella sp. NPDC059898]|uniref:ParA family protein n=1 Tax=Kribbella sp. NPDC059898 TaxID=3346995 RepID=UPI0036577D0A
MTTTAAEVVIDRNLLSRVIALINQKGGVGKSSCATNLAVEYARGGFKVLILELDPQGNLGKEFGYRPSKVAKGLAADPRDDFGTGLAASLTTGSPLNVPLTGVRSYANGGQIDVIPAGGALKPVPVALGVMAVMMKQPYETKLAQLLMPLAGQYHLILIDCPPSDMVLRTLALEAARYVVAPTKSDPGSWEDGLDSLAEEVKRAQLTNEALQVLGVLLFDIGASATKLNEQTRSDIAELNAEAFAEARNGIPPVLKSTIRHVERPAVDARREGRTMSELSVVDLSGPSVLEILRREKDGEDVSGLRTQKRSGSTANVAEDYSKLAAELLRMIWTIERLKLEQAAQTQEADMTAADR